MFFFCFSFPSLDLLLPLLLLHLLFMYFISLACVGDFYGFRLNLLCAVAEVNLLDWLQLCLL